MHSALLSDGRLISAKEYQPDLHGSRIFCLDQSCQAPVIHVQSTDNTTAHYKTTGKGESIHKESCGFFQKLSFQETIAKVSEYQHTILRDNKNEIVVRLNFNQLDPDYKPKLIEREPKEKEKDPEEEIKIKKDNPTPQSITSLKAIKKLFNKTDPDILASIIISVKGLKIPISDLILEHNQAHQNLWTDQLNSKIPYFVHGKISNIVRRDKVWYLNFENKDFSLVIFEPYFKHFTLKDEQLLDQEVFAHGYLKKNTYQKEKNLTEMVIKSQKYIEFI